MKFIGLICLIISSGLLCAQDKQVGDHPLSFYPLLSQELKTDTSIPADSLIKVLIQLTSTNPASSNPQLKAEINQAIGELYYAIHTYDQALRYLTIAKNIYDHQLPELGSIRLLTSIGKAYIMIHW